MNTHKILKQLLLVVVNISFWHGRKALQPVEIAASGIDIEQLPADTLETLELKMAIPPDTAKTFAALKREAYSLILKNGVRFGWEGYAVPREHVAVLLQELLRLKNDFLTAKTDFISGYEQDVAIWLKSCRPAHAAQIRPVVNAAASVHEGICFNYAAIEMKDPDMEGNGLEDEVSSLYDLLCQDVRMSAQRSYEYYFAERKEITRRTLRQVKAIREKLAGMEFLHPEVNEAVELIDQTLNKLPKSGVIEGSGLATVSRLVGRQLATMGRAVSVTPVEEYASEVQKEPVKTATAQQTGNVAPIAWDF